MTSGWQGHRIVFQEIRHRGELVSKPAISSKKSWGRATIERLWVCVPIKDIGRRLPLEVACARVTRVTLFNLCVEMIKPVLVRGLKKLYVCCHRGELHGYSNEYDMVQLYVCD